MNDHNTNAVQPSDATLKALAETHLQIVNSWISNADTKAGLLLASIGILLGFLSAYLNGFSDSFQFDMMHLVVLVPAVYAGFRLLWAAWNCLKALVPVLSPPRFGASCSGAVTSAPEDRREVLSATDGRSLLYFSDIADLSLAELARDYQILADDKVAALYLIEQIHTNSVIARAKFDRIRSAAYSVIHGLLAAVVAVALGMFA